MTNAAVDINSVSRVDSFKAGMVLEIERIMPRLRSVEALSGRFNLDQLQERSIKAPAAFPTVLKSPFEVRADRSVWMLANCACFFVAEGREGDRDQKAWAMAAGFTSILANNMFGMTQVSVPEKIEIDPLISLETRKNGVTIIAVTWRQTIKAFGEGLFGDDHVMLETLYLNGDEEPHYQREEGA